MRLLLAIAALAASAASAHAAEDRYGSSATVARAAAAPYAGPMLSWSGKTGPAVPQSPMATAPARPEMLPGGLYRPGPAPQVPMSQAALQPQRAPLYPPAGYAAPAAAPQSLYSRPTPSTPVAALAPPPSPPAIQGGLYATNLPRYYSVHRAYGETPDPIQMPPPGDHAAYRPEASLAGAVALTGVGDGVQRDGAGDDDSMAGVGAADAADDAERAAKRDAERAAARRAAASGGGK